MKSTAFLSLFLFFAIELVNAQIGTIHISENLPETQTVTGLSILDPGFQNSVIMGTVSGATIFNQSGTYYLMDTKTLQEIKKVGYPDYKEYTALGLKSHPTLEIYPYYYGSEFTLNKNIINFYFRKTDKKYDIFAAQINENLEIPKQPEFLFTTNDRNSIRFLKNDNSDLCIISHRNEYKKANRTTFNYRVYDQNLKLLVCDSVSGSYKSPDTLYTSVFDKGFALVKKMGQKINVKIQDLGIQKTFDLNLEYNNNLMVLEKIKPLKDHTYVLFGKYYKVLKNKDTKGGFFKYVFDPVSGKITEQVYLDHVAAGKDERADNFRFVENIIITETGSCYALTSQYIMNLSQKVPEEYTGKFELVHIHNDSEKWRRQFPIYSRISQVKMFHANGNIYIAFPYLIGPSIKIDYNKYVYGENGISFKQTPQLMMLKIDSKGQVENQLFKDINYRNILYTDNGVIGTVEGNNIMIQSKKKLFRIDLN